jgi:hypothetical protein
MQAPHVHAAESPHQNTNSPAPAENSVAFIRIEPAMLDNVWPRCVPLLEKSFSPLVVDYDLKLIYEECLGGECQLWIALGHGRILAAVITMICQQPKSKSCSILHLGGEDIRLWIDTLDKTITEFALSHGCRYIEAITRKGFNRFVPDFVEDGVVHVKVLKNGDAHV